jgi:hypothetical protein
MFTKVLLDPVSVAVVDGLAHRYPDPVADATESTPSALAAAGILSVV